MNGLQCSVIIRSFNEDRHIGRLLDGIERQQLPKGVSLEVIVVDSGSTDSTVSIAKHMGAMVLHIAKEQFSFGRALNLGCQAASGEILIFASAHVYPVYSDWIEQLIRPFSNPEVGLVYGRQIGDERTRFSEHQVFAKWFPKESDYDQLTPFCNNANCAVRKSLWLEQPYNEYLSGLEDLDWANKAMQKGVKVVYEAGAPIVHIHEETLQKIKNRYRREAIALKHIMPKLHISFWDFVRLFITNSCSDFYHCVRKGSISSEWRSIIGFRYMQFHGTYLGHKHKGEISRELKNRFYYPNGIKRAKTGTVEELRGSKKIEYT